MVVLPSSAACYAALAVGGVGGREAPGEPWQTARLAVWRAVQKRALMQTDTADPYKGSFSDRSKLQRYCKNDGPAVT